MNAPAIKIHKAVRDQVSHEEWEVRVNLATCHWLMAEYDMVEMLASHMLCGNEQMLPGSGRRAGLLEWPAMLRKLDRKDPSYAE